MLLQHDEVLGYGVQLWQDTAAALGGVQHVVADSLHLAVFKSPREGTTLPLHRPFANSLIYQKVEQGIICGGYSPPEASLLWICWFLVREIIRLFEQVIGKWHRLCPRLFPKVSLFGHAPEIMVREETHRREVQTFAQEPDDFGCDLAKPRLAGLIRQQYAKEYSPIATPIPTDVVPNVHHIRLQQSDHFPDCSVDLQLLGGS